MGPGENWHCDVLNERFQVRRSLALRRVSRGIGEEPQFDRTPGLAHVHQKPAVGRPVARAFGVFGLLQPLFLGARRSRPSCIGCTGHRGLRKTRRGRHQATRRGPNPAASSKVNRVGIPRASINQMSGFKVCGSTCLTAARVPSRESATRTVLCGRAQVGKRLSRAVKPGQLLAAGGRDGAVSQRSAGRNREQRVGTRSHNPFRDRKGIAGKLKRPGIERLGHQRVIPQEEQVARLSISAGGA